MQDIYINHVAHAQNRHALNRLYRTPFSWKFFCFFCFFCFFSFLHFDMYQNVSIIRQPSKYRGEIHDTASTSAFNHYCAVFHRFSNNTRCPGVPTLGQSVICRDQASADRRRRNGSVPSRWLFVTLEVMHFDTGIPVYLRLPLREISNSHIDLDFTEAHSYRLSSKLD